MKTTPEDKLPVATRFHLKRYDELVGRTLDRVCVDRATGEPTIGLVFGDKVAWILCDEEGNGPGVLEIQELE